MYVLPQQCRRFRRVTLMMVFLTDAKYSAGHQKLVSWLHAASIGRRYCCTDELIVDVRGITNARKTLGKFLKKFFRSLGKNLDASRRKVTSKPGENLIPVKIPLSKPKPYTRTTLFTILGVSVPVLSYHTLSSASMQALKLPFSPSDFFSFQFRRCQTTNCLTWSWK